MRGVLAALGLTLARPLRFDPEARAEGRDWPAEAETMIGLKRLDNIHECVTDVLRRGVPGDLLEAGAWRGGATILMRALLRVHGDASRAVWVADSFAGAPRPDAARYPADAGDVHWQAPQLTASLADVRANFARYGMLDDRVRFLVGWFRDTLPTAPIEKLAVLRLDANLYESTTDALTTLYPKLSPGGYLIADDYGAVPAAAPRLDGLRARTGITDEIRTVD